MWSEQCGALTAWECALCTGGGVIHTAHYPNERHSHHILSRRKLCDHWSFASSGSQYKSCRSRSSLTPAIQTLVTEPSFHWLQTRMSQSDCDLNSLWFPHLFLHKFFSSVHSSRGWFKGLFLLCCGPRRGSSVRWSVFPPDEGLCSFLSIH